MRNLNNINQTEMKISISKKKKTSRKDEDRRRDMKSELWELLNTSLSDDYVRDVELRFF